METVRRTLDVNIPVAAAYEQWTRFEDFPRFMDGVEEVRRTDDTHLHWRAAIAGRSQEGECVITRQVPDALIAWRGMTGAPNAGHVRLEPLGADMTRISLRLDYEPAASSAQPGEALGLMSRIVERALGDFKDFFEMRGPETDGWRGNARRASTTGP